MQEKTSKLLSELLCEINSKEELDSVRSELFKRGVETLLKAEMTAHLGHPPGGTPIEENIRNGYSSKTIKSSQGDQRIEVPRDRKGSFDPIIVGKHKSMTQELEDCVILLYAKGISNADIVDFMEKTYGVKYSTSQISTITNQLLSDIQEWQNRPLADQYAVLWIDAIHYKIRQDGKVISKACMVVLGIDMDGYQDILSLSILEMKVHQVGCLFLTTLKVEVFKIFCFCVLITLAASLKPQKQSFHKVFIKSALFTRFEIHCVMSTGKIDEPSLKTLKQFIKVSTNLRLKLPLKNSKNGGARNIQLL